MSGWADARGIEARAMSVLIPYLEDRSDGRLVLTGKGVLSKRLQESAGDVILNDNDQRMWTVEIKAEQKHTGNLFLETYSNKNLENRLSHAERGSSMGWLYKQCADLLLYYFLDTGDLYSIDLFKLKRWAFGHKGMAGRIYRFNEVLQQRHGQMNDTWGRLVPIAVISREVGLRHTFLDSQYVVNPSPIQDTGS